MYDYDDHYDDAYDVDDDVDDWNDMGVKMIFSMKVTTFSFWQTSTAG